MSVISRMLKWFPYPVQKKLMDSVTNFYIRPWPPAIDFSRPGLYDLGTEDYLKVREILQPGDIIARRYNNFGSSWLIEGKYTHVGVYLGKVGEIEHAIFHMVPPHAAIDPVATYMAADGVQVWRKKGGITGKEFSSILKEANDIYESRIEYDYEFLIEESQEVRDEKHKHPQTNADRRLYCSEGVAKLYRKVEGVEFALGETRGIITYIPDTFIKDGKGFESILEL